MLHQLHFATPILETALASCYKRVKTSPYLEAPLVSTHILAQSVSTPVIKSLREGDGNKKGPFS